MTNLPTIPDKAITHAGKFHADDVFSAALLRILNPDIQFKRVLSVPENFDGIVFDIGWGKFDHHQSGAPVRENGVPYAAFGLLWKEYGSFLLGEEADSFDEHFIQPLDLEDNTGFAPPCLCHRRIQSVLGLGRKPGRKLFKSAGCCLCNPLPQNRRGKRNPSGRRFGKIGG